MFTCSPRSVTSHWKFFRCAVGLLLLLLVASLLWKGGKTLEVTWALTGITWLIVAGTFLVPSNEDRHIPLILWLLGIVFVLWAWASYYLSSVRNYGFDEMLRIGSLTLLFFWIARRPVESPIRGIILKIISASALLACLVGIAVYLMYPVNRFVGPFLDTRFVTDFWPNAWAEYLLLAWPVTLSLLLRRVQGRGGSVRTVLLLLLHSLPVGVLLGCLLLSYSRAAFVALIGQIVLLAVWAISSRRKGWGQACVLAVGMLLMALAVFVSVNQMRSLRFPVLSPTEKALFLSSEGTSSITERIQFWRQSIVLALEKPLFGWGQGSFRFVQPRIAEQVLAVSDHPHNVFLKAAMDMGLPAALILFLILFFVLSSTTRSCRSIQSSAFSVIPFVFIAVAGVLAHNLVDYNLQFVGIALPLTLCLGTLVPATTVAHSRSKSTKIVQTIELIIATILLLLALREVPFIMTSTLGRSAIARGNTSAALRWFDRSRGEWYSRDLYLTETQALLAAKRFADADYIATIYTNINAQDGRGWKLKAQIADATGNSSSALKYYEKAYAQNRMVDIGTMRGLLVHLNAAKDRKTIDTRKTEFDTLIRQYYLAFQTNAHFILLSRNVNEFLSVIDLMSTLYPEDEPKYQVMAAGVAREAQKQVHSASLSPQ